MKTDYDFLSLRTDVATTWEGASGDGEPILHSGLANPLASGGTYARRFNMRRDDNQNDGGFPWAGGVRLAAIKASVASGAYVGADNTKALDLRFSVRQESTYARGNNVGVFCRSFLDTNHQRNDGGLPHEAFDGYGMSFGPGMNYGEENHDGNGNNPAHVYVNLWARRRTGETGFGNQKLSQVSVDVDPRNSSSFAALTWHRLRFRMVPQADLGATLSAHVLSTPSADESVEGNWVAVASMVITAAFHEHYIPTDPAHRVGFYSSARSQGSDQRPQVLFDNFSATIATL